MAERLECVDTYLSRPMHPNPNHCYGRQVYVVCIFEWVQTSLSTQYALHRFVLMSETHLDIAQFTLISLCSGNVWFVQFVMPAVTATTVQTFLVRRIAALFQRRAWPAFILLVRCTRDSVPQPSGSDVAQIIVAAISSGIVCAVSIKASRTIVVLCVPV